MRTSGILLPVSALPGPGIGTLGAPARAFVDFLVQAGQHIWQVLPVGPTGYGDSPYQSFSAFAGNPYFIDLDTLAEENLLLPAEYETVSWSWNNEDTRVDYGTLYAKRFEILRLAFGRFSAWYPQEWYSWCYENGWWLDDYAAYMTAKGLCGLKAVTEWPEELRLRRPEAMTRLWEENRTEIDFWKFTQFFFYKQWNALHDYARQKGVSILGDIPIYVSPDSADLWASPELFELDENRRPARVAGCPPDYFSPDGQLWGNPLYNWPAHQASGYEWWQRRVCHALQLYDVLRIDHFRGFAGYYAIPATAQTAREGSWCPGPGIELFEALRRSLGALPIVAEDLGLITPDVRELLDATGFPGMKVLQFAFSPDNDYLPHHHSVNCIVYPGTHDNTTAADWYANASETELQFAREYLRWPKTLQPAEAARSLVCCALASVADTCIVPLGDWMGLDVTGRINTPGTRQGNWQWRVQPEGLTEALAQDIRSTCSRYSR